MLPPIEPLHKVLTALQAAGIKAALGGSGLLHSLGLVDTVRDWDLTTDASVEAVTAAISHLPWHQSLTGDQSYATVSRINVTPDGADIDLMVQFAVRGDTGVVHLPTVVCGELEGVPVGSPEVWAVAYALIGRPAKAEMLNDFLRQNGARSDIRALLLAQPLPPELKTMVSGW